MDEDDLWCNYSGMPSPMSYMRCDECDEILYECKCKEKRMNKLDKTYTDLLQDILDNGVTKGDRTGTGTLSVFGRQIRHKMSDGFPLLTTKKMAWKSVVTELLWFLRGDTNIKFLHDNDCHIWDGDLYKSYVKTVEGDKEQYLQRDGYVRNILTKEEFIKEIKHNDEFAKKWGDLGPIYGKQWREWSNYRRVDSVDEVWSDYRKEEPIDQIEKLIHDLKTNPDSRRLMVNAWNVGELDQMVLPPCHYGFQVYTRELSREERVDLYIEKYGDGGMDYEKYKDTIPTRAISLMWNQRSVDTFLGLPFNIASYGLLLEIIAKEVNMVPDELIGNLGDVHLYSNHIEQAKEQIGRKLSLEERAKLVNDNDVNISLRLGDDVLAEIRLDKLNIPKHTREPYSLPKLNIKLHFNNEPSFVPEHWLINDFELEGYQSHPSIKAPLSN
jgi:thymidylate synthase